MEQGFGAYRTDYYNRAAAEELSRRLHAETLLMQGPMGTPLMAEPGAEGIPPVFWNLAEPQAVQRLHALYLAAGADVLLTNTFQASAPALERDGIARSMVDVNRAAVDDARASGGTLIVGSMGPCGISWNQEDSPEYRAARAAYREQAHALLDAGVAAILLETFGSIRDAQPALAGVLDVADGMPVWMSFAVDEEGNLLGDGLSIEGALIYAETHGASSVGVNCCSLDAADAIAPRMVRAARTPVSIRPNAGIPFHLDDGSLAWPEAEERFARSSTVWRTAGVHVVGCCCGASPAVTAAMADALA